MIFRLMRHYELEIKRIAEKNASEFHVMKVSRDRRITELEENIEDIKVKHLDKIDDYEKILRDQEEKYKEVVF